MADPMDEVESTLGGLALSVNESSWPPLAASVHKRIDTLVVDDDTKAVLRQLVCGITESHVRMECMYLSAMPHVLKTDPYLRELIAKTLKATACMAASPAQAEAAYDTVASVYHVVSRAYAAGLEGRSLLREEVLAELEQILDGTS